MPRDDHAHVTSLTADPQRSGNGSQWRNHLAQKSTVQRYKDFYQTYNFGELAKEAAKLEAQPTPDTLRISAILEIMTDRMQNREISGDGIKGAARSR